MNFWLLIWISYFDESYPTFNFTFQPHPDQQKVDITSIISNLLEEKLAPIRDELDVIVKKLNPICKELKINSDKLHHLHGELDNIQDQLDDIHDILRPPAYDDLNNNKLPDQNVKSTPEQSFHSDTEPPSDNEEKSKEPTPPQSDEEKSPEPTPPQSDDEGKMDEASALPNDRYIEFLLTKLEKSQSLLM